MVNRKIKKV